MRNRADRVVYREPAQEFGVSLGRTQSRAFATLSSGDDSSNEMRLLPTVDFTAEPVLISPRKENRRYDVDEREGTLYIRVNDTHVNFRVVTARSPRPRTGPRLIAGHDRHYLLGITSFENLLAIEERIDGLSQIRLRDYDSGAERYIAFPEASYVAGLAGNPRIPGRSAAPVTISRWSRRARSTTITSPTAGSKR